MVRLQRRVAKKSYLNNKRVYRYQRVDLHIPKKYHQAILAFFKRDLKMKLTVQNRKIFIELEAPEEKP